MRPLVNIIWFRRDLRLKDNAALYHALRSGVSVLPIFIFDTAILDQLQDRADKRVAFIHSAITEMQAELVAMGSTMKVFHGKPLDVFTLLVQSYSIQTVFTNHDYEPYALERDKAIADLLAHAGVGFETYKDQVIFEKEEVTKDDGKPYTVFTPYSKKWKAKLNTDYLKPYLTEQYFDAFYKHAPNEIPSWLP